MNPFEISAGSGGRRRALRNHEAVIFSEPGRKDPRGFHLHSASVLFGEKNFAHHFPEFFRGEVEQGDPLFAFSEKGQQNLPGPGGFTGIHLSQEKGSPVSINDGVQGPWSV